MSTDADMHSRQYNAETGWPQIIAVFTPCRSDFCPIYPVAGLNSHLEQKLHNFSPSISDYVFQGSSIFLVLCSATLKRMIIPVIIGAIGIATKSLKISLESIPGNNVQ
jgi:hypothetical protein